MHGKILVVDDEPQMLYIIRIVLKSEGFSVAVCQEGEKALQAIQKEEPSLLVLDLMMPGMNGWEICRAIRQNPTFKDLPIIILSGLPFKDEERRLARELRIYDYITKPFEPIHLMAKVKGLLGAPSKSRPFAKGEYKDADIHKGVGNAKTEVVVLGGGIAGLSAAQTCARSGAEVVLIEEGPFLCEDIVARNELIWSGEDETLPRFIEIVEKLGGAQRSARLKGILLDPETTRVAARQLLQESRVVQKQNAQLIEVIREGANIRGVVLHTSRGTERIEANVLIDTTATARATEFAGILVQDHGIEPSIHLILGGVDGEKLEKVSKELPVYGLASKREALALDVSLGSDLEAGFYEGVKQRIAEIQKTIPGCEHAYLLRRPLGPTPRRKIAHLEDATTHSHVIPKGFDGIFVAGLPLLEGSKSRDRLRDLHQLGRIAGALAGVSVEMNMSIREVPPKAISAALERSGLTSATA